MNDEKTNTKFEDACDRVENLDIHTNSADQAAFCSIAIEYASHELGEKGLDLFAVASRGDLLDYCRLCLKEHPGLDSEMALIVVTHAIEFNAKTITKRTP